MWCGSSLTVMTLSKLVCVYLRVVLFTASVLQDASCALRFMIFIELGGTILRMLLAMYRIDDC